MKQLAENDFSAGVKFGGRMVTARGIDDNAAITALEERLAGLGAPKVLGWRIEFISQAELPEKQEVLDSTPCEEYYPKMESPSIETLDGGWVTPLTNRSFWIETYQVVSEFASKLMQDNLKEGYGEKLLRYKNEINRLMEAGYEGRLPCIGAYRRQPSGDTWLRLTGQPDLTIRQTKSGEGERRARHHKNINGNWDDISGLPEKSRKSKDPKRYIYPGSREVSNLAYQMGQQLKKRAIAKGLSLETQQHWYMLGFCISLRSQCAPYHQEYENQLMLAGIGEEKLRQMVQQSKGQK